ncbi:MAG: hypothetical protein Kow0029_23560 [Candidatus Rifleibacteriota bacterium]
MEEDFVLPDCLKPILVFRKDHEKDCYFFMLIDRFYDLHRRYHQADPQEKKVMRKYMDELSKKISAHQEKVVCFPDMCYECPGKKKCLGCKKLYQRIELLNLAEENQKKRKG